ncbi:MAG: rhodanese-like domain-containing protein [Pyrinomonadaceae bacterium]
MDYSTITPAELTAKRAAGESIRLIDVREPPEFEIAQLADSLLLPMSQINEWLGQLDPAEAIAVLCHHGIRSAHVCAYLVQSGFQNVSNIAGGIDRWSAEVDQSLPRY